MRRAVPLAWIVGCQPAWDQDRFLDRYSAAVCAQEQACDPDSWLLALGTDACEEEVAAAGVTAFACEPFDPATAEACVRAVEASGCDGREAEGQGPEVCSRVFERTDCVVPGFVGVGRAGGAPARVRSARGRGIGGGTGPGVCDG